MKPQENENLQIEYPEVRQMKPGNHGYDYIIVNEHGVELRVEFKERDRTAKYDITKYQADHCDIFALRDNYGELWFMSNKLYMSLCKPHSAWPKHQEPKSHKQISNAAPVFVFAFFYVAILVMIGSIK